MSVGVLGKGGALRRWEDTVLLEKKNVPEGGTRPWEEKRSLRERTCFQGKDTILRENMSLRREHTPEERTYP